MPDFQVERIPSGYHAGCYMFAVRPPSGIVFLTGHFHPWVEDSGFTILGSYVAALVGSIGDTAENQPPCKIWLRGFPSGGVFLPIEIPRNRIRVSNSMPPSYVNLSRDIVRKYFDLDTPQWESRRVTVHKSVAEPKCVDQIDDA